MINHKLLPPALRLAPVEKQLSYLLQRRTTIDHLLQALERYCQQGDRTVQGVEFPEISAGTGGRGASA